MFLKAGALSLALLLASRVLGLVRESAQAAAFGASGMGDVAVLMLTLPDWIAGLLASGALAYVLVPAWAAQTPAQVHAIQRRAALSLLGGGAVLAAGLLAFREPMAMWMAPGLPRGLLSAAVNGLVWSALAVPAALLASLWATRLQHERDFTGMYAANLVVNVVLIAAIAVAGWGWGQGERAVMGLGLGLLAAMALRLAWLAWRQPRAALAPVQTLERTVLPGAPLWLWAVLSAGLPLALPFIARSAASASGEGALAVFNYAWKLVELPLVLGLQLVAALAFPSIARGLAPGNAEGAAAGPIRSAFALGWTVACASAAALLVGAGPLAELLFGWGRMDAPALERVEQWGAAAAWGLLPQSLSAVALTVLASQSRLRPAVTAYALAAAALLMAVAAGVQDGLALMRLLNGLFAAVALLSLLALGRPALGWLPWRAMACAFAGLLAVAAASGAQSGALRGLGTAAGLGLAAVIGVGLTAFTWLASPQLRQALRR